MIINLWQRFFSLAAVALLTGCTLVERVGIALLYKKAPLPDAQVTKDLAYAGANSLATQRLDLFLPTGTNWPVFIFVHGGNWDAGDKGLRVGGADVYGNIGRFYAAHGVGVAVINYRLQPAVDWRARFGSQEPREIWQREASPITYLTPDAPPFLILYAAGESVALQRQAQLLDKALEQKSVPHRLVVVPGQSHARMVLTLSRPDETSAPAILDFISSVTSPH